MNPVLAIGLMLLAVSVFIAIRGPWSREDRERIAQQCDEWAKRWERLGLDFANMGRSDLAEECWDKAARDTRTAAAWRKSWGWQRPWMTK